MPKSRTRRKTLPNQITLIRRTQPRHFLKPIASVLIAVVSFLAACLGVWETYVDTFPVVTPHGSSAPSSFTLPFIVKNPSGILSMTDVVLTCQLIEATFGGVSIPPHSWGLETTHMKVDGRISSTQKNVRLAPREIVNFSCDNSGIQDANLNGIPQVVERMRVGIIVNFDTLGIRRHFASESFTWAKMASGSYEWMEGKTIH